MPFRVSAPNRAVTFTSGPGTKPTFRLRVEGDLDEFEVLEIDADVEGYSASEYEGDINNLLTIEHVGTSKSLPSKEYLPTASTSKANLAFQVYRGRLHDQEGIQTYTVQMTVKGIKEDDEEEMIGADTVTLEG